MHRQAHPRTPAILALAATLAAASTALATQQARPVIEVREGQPLTPAVHLATLAAHTAAYTAEAGVDNAALLYNRYFALLADTDLPGLARDFDFNDPVARPGAQPNDTLAKALDDNAPLIEGIIRASTRPTCDWGIERDQGPAALLNHLGPTRAAVRVLAADARHQLAQGNHDAAVERHATILRIADHLTQDRVLISSLVSMAIANLAAAEAQAIGAELPAESRKVLFAEFQQRAFAGDPFGVREALKGERELFLDWVTESVDTTDDGRAFIKLAEDAGVGAESLRRVATMSADQLQTDLDKAGTLYDAIDAVWTDPDASAKLEALNKLVATGAYGQTATVFAPNVTRIYDNDQRSRETLRKAAEVLAGL